MATAPVYTSPVTGIFFTYDNPNLGIGWDETDALDYRVSYRIGSNEWTEPVVVESPEITIPGLEVSQLYQFRVVARRQLGLALPAYKNLIIPSGSEGPNTLELLGKTPTTASIQWAGPDGTYVVIWVDSEGNEYNSGLITQKSYLLRDLVEGANYKIYVYRSVGDEVIGLPNGLYIDKESGCCSPISAELNESGTTTVPATTTVAATTTVWDI